MRKTLGILTAAVVFMMAVPAATATHPSCTPEQADPSSINEIDLTSAGEGLFYLEERNSAAGAVPGTGFVTGDGTWFYEEDNTLDGLQRGGIGITGSCFPPEPLPCVLIDEDPITDENCDHGPDAIIF